MKNQPFHSIERNLSCTHQNGKDFTGIVKAETQADAHGKIRGLGLFPTSINQVGIKSGGQNTVQETRQPQKEEPVVEKSSSGGGTIAGIIAFIVLSLLFNSKMRHDFFGLFKSNPATQSAPVTPATPSYTPSATPSYDQTRESRINELVRQGYDRAKATEAVDLVGTRFDK